MKKHQILLLAAALVMTAVPLFAETPPAAPAAAAPAVPAPPPPPPKANKPGIEVPPWSAQVLGSDKTFSSDSLKGKTYALIFVNSSCSACRNEIGALQQRTFGDRLTVLVVAVDAKLDRIEAAYREGLKVTWPILEDPKFTIARKFGIGFTPASVIVGKDGKVVAWSAGYTADNEDATLKEFDKFVK